MLKDDYIPTVLPGRRFIKAVDCSKWTRLGTMIFGRTISGVCVDERSVWTAFLWEAYKELVYQSNISYKYISRTFKPITDNGRIPDVTIKLDDVNWNDGLPIILVLPESDCYIWLRHHFCPAVEQPGGYQSLRKHTVIMCNELVVNSWRLLKDLLREYDCPPLSVFPYLKRPKRQMVHNHIVCREGGETGKNN